MAATIRRICDGGSVALDLIWPCLGFTARYVRWRTDRPARSQYTTRVHRIPVGQAVLQKVVAKLAGVGAAAARLGAPPANMVRYLEGTASVPDYVLLRAIDVVLDESPQSP